MTLPEPFSLDFEPQVRDLPARLDVRLIDGAGRHVSLPLNRRARGFTASARWHDVAPPPGFWQARAVELSLISHDEPHEGLGIQIAVALDGPARQFMIPGIFYGVNRLPASRARYPCFDDQPVASDSLTADHWSFRADRASHPVVIGWSETECVALATGERSLLGLSGLGFRGDASGSGLLLNFPAREEPVTYVGHDAPGPSEVLVHRWQAGEIATVNFQIFVGPPDPHQYDPLLRTLYTRAQEEHGVEPWMSVEAAAALTAHGLYRWHYRPHAQLLAETCAFDAPLNGMAPATGGPDSLHAGWLSGAAPAYAMLTYGRDEDIWEFADAAVAVLDRIAGVLAPLTAEATLFMTRALAFEETREHDHPAWKTAIVSSLSRALQSQPDGEGAAGLLWIPALLEGAAYLDGVEVVATAERAGAHYAGFVEDEFIHGASEDGDLAPSSMDGSNAVLAYVSLFEATGAPRWLRLARRAADWMMTFRFAYNIDFPAHTTLQTYDFRSRGADVASPRNQHLHGNGLICLPEMIRLARHTGDDYYLERTRDNLACFLQFIAREDGDFNARKGMVSGRYYNTRGIAPKGTILPTSHARTASLVLYGCQAGLPVEP